MSKDLNEKQYDPSPKRKKLGTTSKVVLAAAVIGGAAIIGYPLLKEVGLTPTVLTSNTEEFQDPADGDGFGRITIEDTPRPAPTQLQQLDLGPIEQELDAQRQALEAQNRQLATDVARLQGQLQELADGTSADDGTGQAELAEALQAVQAQNAELIVQLQADFGNRLAQADVETQRRLAEERAAREQAAAQADVEKAEADERSRMAAVRQQQLTEQIIELQRTNQALADQMSEGMNQALLEQSEQMRLAELDREERARRTQIETDRRVQLQQRQAEAAALREAQIRSEAVIFDAGGSVSSPGLADATASQPSGQPRALSGDASGRDFVLNGAPSAQITTAEVIANPSNTILQGTIIKASLETAIDSSLPGQIAAIVNRPVYSFDQSRVLVPQGSRLFGMYDSDVSLGQNRLLVGWTRLVTPDGQSVQLAAFGADDQGRSGVTGDVNNRFGLRFGSAALLSIIGAGPSLAAAGADSEIGAEAAERIAENFAQTTNAVIGQYATLPPIISIQPGAAISVIVDRDLEFY